MDPQLKRHKNKILENNCRPFPVENVDCKSVYKYSGYFSGLNVEIFEAESIKAIYENGCFGISSETQVDPKVLWKGDIAPTKVPQHLFVKKCAWRQQVGGYDKDINIEVITKLENHNDVSDNSSAMAVEEVDDASLVTKSMEIDPFHIEESLVLTLEESFFLHYTLKCLRIMDVSGKEIETHDLLLKFYSLDRHFWTHFVAYLYLRRKNWIVKCGIKFGGDFLLYKRGPKYYHASYIVLVRRSNSKEHSTTRQLHGHYRIAETTQKELLIVEIYYPEQMSEETNPVTCLEKLKSFTASEMLIKRFNFQHEH